MVNFGLGPLGMAPTTLPEISNPAIPENILIGKEALNGAEDLIVGTMENNGAIEEDIELVDQVVEIPLGFHDGDGFVQIAADEQAKIIPENILAGITILGVEGSAIELDGEEIEVNPTTDEQIFVPTEGNGFTEVVVTAVTSNIDEYIVPANIIEGVTILGVNGEAVELDGEEIEIEPDVVEQVYTPEIGNGFTKVTVAAVTSDIDEYIVPANIIEGITILGVEGTAVELDGEELEVEATTIEQVITPDEGNGFTKVTVAAVTSDIDENILSENIKAGVTILGVNGKASVVDTADATANAEEILEDKVAYVNGVKVTGTYVKPILHKPTVSIEDGVLTITPNADNGIYAEGYKIYADETLLTTTPEMEIDLDLLLNEPGTYAITVATHGTSFTDSPETEAVEFVVAE
jgi:hypothetical protein